MRSLHGYLSELLALSMDWNEGAPTMSEDRPKVSFETLLDESRTNQTLSAGICHGSSRGAACGTG